MRFSPDGTHLLGGVGNSRIYLDGQIPPALADLHAGGWGWISETVIAGPGGFDSPFVGFYQYDLLTQRKTLLLNGAQASQFYGGAGWSAFLASRVNPGSFDSEGNRWSSRVVVARSPDGWQAFTTGSNRGLIVRLPDRSDASLTTGTLGQVFDFKDGVLLYSGDHSLRALYYVDPWAPPSQGMRFCTRPADGTKFIAGYVAGFGLCFFQWQGVSSGPCPGIVLSGDGHDFAPDTAWRADGIMVVGSGVNEGETSQRLYELDLSRQRWRVNSGTWHVMAFVDLMRPPVNDVPIPVPVPLPVPVPVPMPTPIPEVDMFYALTEKPLPATGFDVIPQADGTVALRNRAGKFMEVDSFGNWQERDSPDGGDAKFKRGLNGGLIAADRGGDHKNYVIEGAEG